MSSDQPVQNAQTVDYNISEQWDASIDTILKNFAYGAAGGLAVSFVLLRGRTARIAGTAFGAGTGFGAGFHEHREQFATLWKNLGTDK